MKLEMWHNIYERIIQIHLSEDDGKTGRKLASFPEEQKEKALKLYQVLIKRLEAGEYSKNGWKLLGSIDFQDKGTLQ